MWKTMGIMMMLLTTPVSEGERRVEEVTFTGLERTAVQIDEILVDVPLEDGLVAFLLEETEARGVEFELALAVMGHESKFDPDVIGVTNDYGLFQVNPVNHEWLAAETGTDNAPLDPETNIRWGVYLLSELTNRFVDEGLAGENLEIAVLSSYNRGVTGFYRNGPATEYVQKVNEVRDALFGS